ncbi:Uncharacterized membrane protein [Lachnospiraceae bacterium XBB1006]|nr:Uncharacterized membrane protein [Lachnospiraceae bacterium XBB1006]
MTRQEFISELRIALQGQVDQATIQDNLNYYETYIMQESRKGRTEQEVLEELGNPRLIAKTIISSQPEREEYEEERVHQSAGNNSNFDFHINGKAYGGWKGKVLAITAVIAFFVIIVGVIALVAGTISLLAPILVPVLLILLALRLISRR